MTIELVVLSGLARNRAAVVGTQSVAELMERPDEEAVRELPKRPNVERERPRPAVT